MKGKTLSKGPEENLEMSFWDHLSELRNRLMRMVAAVILAGIIAFIFIDYIYSEIILAPGTGDFLTNRIFCQIGYCINNHALQIININLAGQFQAGVLIAALTGIVITMPYLLFELWLFVKPALYQQERMAIRGFVFFSSIMFFAGLLFGYFVITPLILEFFSTYQLSPSIENNIQLSSYLSNVIWTPFSAGVLFELPVVVYYLSKTGILTAGILKKYRKYAIVLIFVISAVITPPDVVSQLLVAMPLLLLYETGVWIASREEKKRINREKAG
ncbi:MAG: twin-arginine translocase subunit TatC [Bacteroidetes bacterium]|nr:twin-arginine translocase subunit TatC [Bacteroidota bacterium]